MTPAVYRYRDSETVIKHLDGYTPPEGWEPLYSQAQFDQLQAQLVRQQASYEAEIKVEIDAALERACDAVTAVDESTWFQNQLAFGIACRKAIRALKDKK